MSPFNTIKTNMADCPKEKGILDPLEEEMATSILQYSWLENPMDRGAWQATVYGVAKSQIWLKQLTHCTQD